MGSDEQLVVRSLINNKRISYYIEICSIAFLYSSVISGQELSESNGTEVLTETDNSVLVLTEFNIPDLADTENN
jgi:hypothetical protein